MPKALTATDRKKRIRTKTDEMHGFTTNLRINPIEIVPAEARLGRRRT